MSKEIYILTSQVHFGSLKTSVAKGTKVVIDRKSKVVEINGVKRDNIADIELGIKAGYIIPFVEGKTVVETTVKISPKAKEKHDKKMEIQKSDEDMMLHDIDISDTKKEVRDAKRKEKMKISYEKSEDSEERGLKVVANEQPNTIYHADTDKEILKVINGDDDYNVITSIKPKVEQKSTFGLAISTDSKETVEAVNNQEGMVVAKIGNSKADTKPVNPSKVLVTKRASKDVSDKAKATAEARKTAIATRRAKTSEVG